MTLTLNHRQEIGRSTVFSNFSTFNKTETAQKGLICTRVNCELIGPAHFPIYTNIIVGIQKYVHIYFLTVQIFARNLVVSNRNWVMQLVKFVRNWNFTLCQIEIDFNTKLLVAQMTTADSLMSNTKLIRLQHLILLFMWMHFATLYDRYVFFLYFLKRSSKKWSKGHP